MGLFGDALLILLIATLWVAAVVLGRDLRRDWYDPRP